MKNNRFRIFVINPGSTSTKLALFENNIKILETSVTHDAEVLNSFAMPNDQLGYRMEVIKDFVEKNDIELDNIDAFVGRGGGCYPVPSGTFEVNDILLNDIRNNVGRTIHPSILGVQLAYEMQQKYGGRLFMVDPICVDEYTDVARVTEPCRCSYRWRHNDSSPEKRQADRLQSGSRRRGTFHCDTHRLSASDGSARLLQGSHC